MAHRAHQSPPISFSQRPIRSQPPMDGPQPKSLLCVGAWCVNPTLGEISRAGETIRLEARTMRLLLYLATRPGDVVSIDELLSHVWEGVVVTPDSVYQAVASLRRVLGDVPKQSTYIATVPRLGYRMVATVSPWDEPIEPTILEPTLPRAALTSAATDPPTPAPGRRIGTLLVTGVALGLALVGTFLFHSKLASNPHADATVNALPQSVAVLPFLDLTSQEMNEEYFADGMTEELIGKLSKVPGLRVPAPTSSFYFKGKQTTVADAAEALGVAYVVDGSVRKAGTTLRIAARLIRADNGFVVWSETYDRPLDDVLMVQNDIASEVTKALTVSINPSARPAATAP